MNYRKLNRWSIFKAGFLLCCFNLVLLLLAVVCCCSHFCLFICCCSCCFVCACVCMCVCARARARVRACVRACVREWVYACVRVCVCERERGKQDVWWWWGGWVRKREWGERGRKWEREGTGDGGRVKVPKEGYFEGKSRPNVLGYNCDHWRDSTPFLLSCPKGKWTHDTTNISVFCNFHKQAAAPW